MAGIAPLRARAVRVINILRALYPSAGRGETAGSDTRRPFQVMVATIISQRNRDEVTEKVSDALLRKADTPDKILKLGRAGIAKTIRSANFYKTKARHILEAARMVRDEFGGRMPRTREELMELPGVGGKTADIIMLVSHGAAVVPVDTHVQVVSQRLGWTTERDPEKIRADLHRLFEPKVRGYVNILLVEFGKEICRMHLPRCYACPVEKLCQYPNKTKPPARKAPR
ncbi:MAG: endonuclease III [Candidatus Aenigmarchaeota archaeon]|nr:endonuclease III [Candidatus Aenigmarchaeota archaeon]